MLILPAKLALAPALIALVTVAGRRWGPEVSGWLAGLPITGGPILLFIALEQGEAYAARSALAALVGVIAFTAFCLVFAWSARRIAWWLALPLGYAAYFLAGWPVTRWHPGIVVGALAGAGVLVVGAAALPRGRDDAPPLPHGRWELPLRMAATAAVVLTVTALAEWLGAGWVGVLSVFPTAATVLGAFSLRHAGVATAARVLRGLSLGMLGLVGFFAVLAAALGRMPIAQAFALGVVAALAAQAATLVALRLARRQAVPPAEPRHSQASSQLGHSRGGRRGSQVHQVFQAGRAQIEPKTIVMKKKTMLTSIAATSSRSHLRFFVMR